MYSIGPYRAVSEKKLSFHERAKQNNGKERKRQARGKRKRKNKGNGKINYGDTSKTWFFPCGFL